MEKKIYGQFQNGSCKLKSECQFMQKNLYKKICKYFKQGLCKKGDQCQFYHQIENIGPKQQSINKSQSIKDKQKILKIRAQNIIEKQLTYQEIDKQEIKIEQKEQQIRMKKVIKQSQKEGKPLQKINMFDSIFGHSSNVNNQQQKTISQPQVNDVKKISVTFIDIRKTPEGKQNIERINKQIFEDKPYLEYLKYLIDPKHKQVVQMIRKYQYSFLYRNQEKNIFLLRISPVLDNKQIKSNFDIREKCLELQIIDMNKIQLINQSIPYYFRQQINRKFQIIKQTKNIYQTVKHIQNNFEQIFHQVDWILENKIFHQKDLTFAFDGHFQELQKKQNSILNIMTQQANNLEQTQGENELISQIQYNTTIYLQTLQTNAQSLLTEQILLHLTCQCQSMITYTLKAYRKKNLIISSKIKCSKCKQIIVIYFKRQIMHKDALKKMVGQIGCINAKIQDAGALLWQTKCICDRIILSSSLSLSGIKKIIKCLDCFKQYYILYFGIFKETPYFNDQKSNKVKQKNKKKQNLFKLDIELPNKGICKHAKFNFRYFRFPCCGRLFPCQKCHQQKTHIHHYEKPIVILCGYCSCQQTFTDNCKRCKKQLIKGSEKSGNWEGGKRSRDQTLLSRNDAKKYVGLNKTVVNKK